MLHTYKIINDPIYGLIKINDEALLSLINHPFFQRLRRIKQMGLAEYVYPGAVHTRFQHSIGAAHLMNEALMILKEKGANITDVEHKAATYGILLHDIGHGPFSHALEYALIEGVHHEDISVATMRHLNQEFEGILDTAFDIYTQRHPKTFLHQLISGQLDMDRMDYLNRDSFYSGVSEGIIGYDRILQMLNIVDNELVIEEKGIHSIEKFIIARRLMYWQVYLHKTVISTEKLLNNILKRAKQLTLQDANLFASEDLNFFLYESISKDDLSNNQILSRFMNIDDTDIIQSIKAWTRHSDSILATLCQRLLHRALYKVKLTIDNPLEQYQELLETNNHLSEQEKQFYIVKGVTDNSTYSRKGSIKVLHKDKSIKDITEVDHALIHPLMGKTVQKHYLGWLPGLVHY